MSPVKKPPDPRSPPSTESTPKTTSSLSYADKVKTNIRYDQRLKRNVLEIEIERTNVETNFTITDEALETLLSKLGMSIQLHVEGYQVSYSYKKAKIEILCKEGLDLVQFCRQEKFIISPGMRTTFIRPAGRRDVEVIVSGLSFNTPDTLVQNYITKFGGKLVRNDVIYGKHSEGPFKGKTDGTRKYQVDF